MTEILAARLVNALLAKGFERQQTHHTMLWLVVRGRRTGIHTWISHGERKLDESLLRCVARELHLSKAELLRFIACELGAEEYVRLLVERKHLPPSARFIVE